MKLIDRYIIRQYLSTFLFIMGMVLCICILVDVMEKLDNFLEDKPPITEIVFDYYLNFIPFWGINLAPICIFLAVIFFTSRMAQRTELVPLLSGGVSFYRILVPYIITAIFLSGVSFYFKSFLVPVTTEKQIDFEYKYNLRGKRISSNTNIHKKIASDSYVFIGYYNEKRKEGSRFSMERFKDGELITKLHAKRLVWVDSTESWRLFRVNIRHIDGLKERLEFHDQQDTIFLLKPDDIFIREEKAASLPLPDLIEYTKLEEMRGSDILKELYIERHRRFADPIAIIILTLIGFAMSSKKSRGGVALQIGLGLLICFLFVGLLFAGQATVGDKYPAWLAVWFPNLIFFPFSIFLLRIAPK